MVFLFTYTMKNFYLFLLAVTVSLVSSCSSCNQENGGSEAEYSDADTVSQDDSNNVDANDTVLSDQEIVEPRHGDSDKKVDEEIVAPDEEEQIDESDEDTNSENLKIITFINSEIGTELTQEKDFDLMGYAAQEVVLLRKIDCEGEDCGKLVQMQNYNHERAIDAIVQVKWKVGKNKFETLREYEIKAGDVLDIGCTRNCDLNGEKANWKIVSAKYAE